MYEHRVVTKIRIDELNPRAREVWKTICSFRPEWNGTTITFDLRAEDGDTVLSFAPRGFMNADQVYTLTTTGSGYNLVSLQQNLKTGDLRGRIQSGY